MSALFLMKSYASFPYFGKIVYCENVALSSIGTNVLGKGDRRVSEGWVGMVRPLVDWAGSLCLEMSYTDTRLLGNILHVLSQNHPTNQWCNLK